MPIFKFSAGGKTIATHMSRIQEDTKPRRKKKTRKHANKKSKRRAV